MSLPPPHPAPHDGVGRRRAAGGPGLRLVPAAPGTNGHAGVHFQIPVRGGTRRLVAPDGPYQRIKAVAERLFAALLLVAALPVIGLAALLVKLTSPGPAFYSQTRLGRRGVPFRIYKIRTMRHNCEAGSGPRWSTPGDPRITRVGQWLRRSHVDELPQLINVLRGHMSLIGPRPERPEFLPTLEEALPGYRKRLLVRPGVTGLAQVHLPADTDLASVRRKIGYDFYYIAHAGPWLDLRLFLCTACYGLGIPFSWGRRLCRLPKKRAIEDFAAAFLPPPFADEPHHVHGPNGKA